MVWIINIPLIIYSISLYVKLFSIYHILYVKIGAIEYFNFVFLSLMHWGAGLRIRLLTLLKLSKESLKKSSNDTQLYPVVRLLFWSPWRYRITPSLTTKFTLSQRGCTCLDKLYESNGSVWKLVELDKNNWYRCEQMTCIKNSYL